MAPKIEWVGIKDWKRTGKLKKKKNGVLLGFGPYLEMIKYKYIHKHSFVHSSSKLINSNSNSNSNKLNVPFLGSWQYNLLRLLVLHLHLL